MCTQLGWGLSIMVALTMCIFFVTKARSRQAPLRSSSFRQIRCVGLMLQARATARSDEDRSSLLLFVVALLRLAVLRSLHAQSSDSTLARSKVAACDQME